MIIGNGLLAKSFSHLDGEELLIFASGVSNSLETEKSEFKREELLLRKCITENQEKKIIYFSTSSIYDHTKKESLYVLHKLEMEKIISTQAQFYSIYRIGNVVGNGGNINTLFNFLSHKIKNKEVFKLYKNAKRPLIDVDDIAMFFKASDHKIFNKNIDLSFPYQYSMIEIVKEIECFYDIKSLHFEINEGDQYDFDFSEEVIHFFKEENKGNYLKKIVKKYAV